MYTDNLNRTNILTKTNINFKGRNLINELNPPSSTINNLNEPTFGNVYSQFNESPNIISYWRNLEKFIEENSNKFQKYSENSESVSILILEELKSLKELLNSIQTHIRELNFNILKSRNIFLSQNNIISRLSDISHELSVSSSDRIVEIQKILTEFETRSNLALNSVTELNNNSNLILLLTITSVSITLFFISRKYLLDTISNSTNNMRAELANLTNLISNLRNSISMQPPALINETNYTNNFLKNFTIAGLVTYILFSKFKKK